MGLVAPVVLVAPRLVGRAGPVELVLVGQGDRAELMGLVAPVLRVHPRLVGRAGPVEPDLAHLVAPAVLVPPVAMAPGDRVDLAPRVVPVDRVELMSRVVPVDRVELTSRVVPVDRVELTSRVGLANRVGLTSLGDRAGPVDLAVPDLTGPAAPVDRHRRRTSNTVSTTGVARSGVVPGTLRMGSARRITVRRLRRGNAASGGTTDLRLAVRRPTGTAHRLLAAGTGRHLLAAGTVDGMGRLATSVWHRPISGRLPTAASTPYRSSTRFSVGGASGSSATGYRCTDLTARSPD